MYFPYLRGRQFELIALRELLEKELIHENIIPIIEPVKLSSTLNITLKKFIEMGKSLVVIHNPCVGSFETELEKESPLKEAFELYMQDSNLIKAHIVNERSKEDIQRLDQLDVSRESVLSIVTDRDCLDIYRELFGDNGGRFNLISDDRALKRSVINKVLLDDKFKKLSKNSEYKDKDEFFSEDHLYYLEEGYAGFSDYSIVGSDYSESGFAPYAVAIHIVYFDSDKKLRIKHFVSESNDDIQDPAGKFYEAVGKLYEWTRENPINTHGISELIKHYKNETYPGLGTVKKLSIMHHIELISQYFGEVE